MHHLEARCGKAQTFLRRMTKSLTVLHKYSQVWKKTSKSFKRNFKAKATIENSHQIYESYLRVTNPYLCLFSFIFVCYCGTLNTEFLPSPERPCPDTEGGGVGLGGKSEIMPCNLFLWFSEPSQKRETKDPVMPRGGWRTVRPTWTDGTNPARNNHKDTLLNCDAIKGDQFIVFVFHLEIADSHWVNVIQ